MKWSIALFIFVSLSFPLKALAVRSHSSGPTIKYEVDLPTDIELEEMHYALKNYVAQAEQALQEQQLSGARISKNPQYQEILQRLGLSTDLKAQKLLIIEGLAKDVSQYEFSEMDEKTRDLLRTALITKAFSGQYMKIITLVKKISILDLAAFIESQGSEIKPEIRSAILETYVKIDNFMIKVSGSRQSEPALLFARDFHLNELQEAFKHFQESYMAIFKSAENDANPFEEASQNFRDKLSSRFDGRRANEKNSCAKVWGVLLSQVLDSQGNATKDYYFFNTSMKEALASKNVAIKELLKRDFILEPVQEMKFCSGSKCYTTQYRSAMIFCNYHERRVQLQKFLQDSNYNTLPLASLMSVGNIY